MPSMPGSGVEWLKLVCPRCHAPFRIKAVYAHLPGHCPECRGWIAAPRPESKPPRSATEDDLLPIEEEWPEAGQPLEDNAGPTYGFTAPPLDWDLDPPAPPKQPLAETEETYSFAPGHEPQRRAEEPVRKQARVKHEPYSVLPVQPNPPPPVEPDPAMLDAPKPSWRERFQEVLPPPPTRPFIDGVWTFPFQPANLLPLFWLAFSYPILALIVTAVVTCAQKGGIYLFVVALGSPLALALFFWIGTYASNCFLAAVEETAAGADRIAWPTGGNLAEGISKLLYLLWVGALAGVVVALPWLLLLNAVGGSLGWTVLAVIPWGVVFAVFLLSSMAASSRFLILEPRTIAALFKKPHVALILFLASIGVLGPPLALTYVALSVPSFLAALGGGVLWAVCFLLYARLLGRAGYVLTDTGRLAARVQSRQPAPQEADEADDEAQAD